jgi:hypothetical protein
MSCSDVAESFFLALAEARWRDAVACLGTAFKREHATHVRHRFAVGIHSVEQGAGADAVPEDLDELLALWLEQADFRTEAARALAEARREQPDHEWEVVGGVEPPRRRVVGEVHESDDQAIVVYRRGRGEGIPTTLQLRREDGQWRICSEEFALEGHPGLWSAPRDSETPEAD